MLIGRIEIDPSKKYVFIYTFHHNVDGQFDVRINGTEGMPDWWRDLVLEYNSDDLTEEERWTIGEIVFGKEYHSKWDKRTDWNTFIGTYDDWLTNLCNHVRDGESTMESIFHSMLHYKSELQNADV